MPYVADPTNDSQPTEDINLETAAAEFRALKRYIRLTLLEPILDAEANVEDLAAQILAAYNRAEALVAYGGAWSTLTGAKTPPLTVTHGGFVYFLNTAVADVTAHTPGVSAVWTVVATDSTQISHGAGTVSSEFTTQTTRVDAILANNLGGYRNKLINGCPEINQRALATVADDAYFFDRWYALTESGSLGVTALTDPEPGAPFGFRLTQPDASPKRMGFAQIIESHNIRQHASQAMHLAARLRLSANGNIRYAVLEHTGTTDVVTSDIVNNWASATFTPGNFFIAGLTVLATGTIAPGATVWGEVDNWAALSASVKNVIIAIWTEAQVAQNVTLDLSRAQYEPGQLATPHEWRMTEDMLCARYAYALTNMRPMGQAASASAVTSIAIHTPAVMRTNPTISSASHSFTNSGGGSVAGFTVTATNRTGCSVRLDASGGSGLVAGDATIMVPTAGTMLLAEL